MKKMTQDQNNKADEKFNKVNSLVINHDKFLVAIDGSNFDAVASALGLTQLLKSMEKDVFLYSSNPIPEKFWDTLQGRENFQQSLGVSANRLLLDFDCPLGDIEKVSSLDEEEKLRLSVEFKEGKVIDSSKVKIQNDVPSFQAGFILGVDIDSGITEKGRWVWFSRQGIRQHWAEVNMTQKEASFSESMTSLISRCGFQLPVNTLQNFYMGIKKATKDFDTADSIALETAAYCLKIKEGLMKQKKNGQENQPQSPVQKTPGEQPLEQVENKEGKSLNEGGFNKPPIFTGTTTPQQ